MHNPTQRAAHTEENPSYLEQQLLTCIGNKRNLLHFIGKGLDKVISRTGKNTLDIFDVFSGSGVVARFFKRYARRLITSDLETYSWITNRCYLSNTSQVPFSELEEWHQHITCALEKDPLEKGLIAQNYAPADDLHIQEGERVFYTARNARYIDSAIKKIHTIPPHLQHYFLGPLLSEASIHTNTSGVFKGFYKDSLTGIGKFGGNRGDALERILGDIHLPFPIFSKFECDVETLQGDSNEIAKNIRNLDVAYIDPPYNQHPYGSNYFMLNLIAENRKPKAPSKVSGIPTDWNRSQYNTRQKAAHVFEDLVRNLDSRFLLISFNSEGFIAKEEMINLLRRYGRLDVLETSYNTFRGSRNLKNRDKHVTEYLYLLEKIL